MNSVVEKLAAIEREVAAIQPKMAPLTKRIADIDHKAAGFAQQLAGIAEESAAVKQDIDLTRKSLARIQTLIGESKVESEQLAVGQEESLHRCETMTAVFGAAFQAMSQFFETAQRLGIADQAKAVFQNLPPESAAAFALPAIPAQTVPAQTMADTKPLASVIPPVVDEVHPTFSEKPVEEPVSEAFGMLPASLPDIAELPAESVNTETVAPEETPAVEAVSEEGERETASDVFQERTALPEPAAIPEPATVSKESQEFLAAYPAALPDMTLPESGLPESGSSESGLSESEPSKPEWLESALSESTLPESKLPESPPPKSDMIESEIVQSENAFDDSECGGNENLGDENLGDEDFGNGEQNREESSSQAVPSLPDVASLPEMASPRDEMGAEMDGMVSDVVPSQEIASQLDVPPLHLSIPALPAQGESASEEMNDQEIEDMLASMMTPVTAGAGN